MRDEDESFGFITYNDRPVASQRAAANGCIEVKFYDQPNDPERLDLVEIVSEDDWNSFSARVLMPKERGRRAHILRNWREYKEYAIRRE